MTTTPSLTSCERSAEHGPWLGETLGRLLAHVRKLLRVDSAVFHVVGAGPFDAEPTVEWFAAPEVRDVLAPRLREAAERAHAERASPEVSSAPGGASVIACPAEAAGRTLGVLVVGSQDQAHPLGPAELRTVEVLADLAAMALERAELLDREGRRAREELMLVRAAEDVSGSLELEDVYARVLSHAIAATGATKAAITRFNAPLGELAVAASVDFSSRFARRRVSIETGMLGSVARTRTPYLSHPSDADRWDQGAIDEEGVRSFIHVPIELGPRLFGVLTVAHAEAGRFGQADLERLTSLARSSAAAVANALDFQRERRIARALSIGFVPEPLPEVPGYDTGLLYSPASNEPVGGDVYGAWRLSGGEVAMLVGDVAGKGVETAALSAMVRFFIEARSWDSTSPGTVISETNAVLAGRIPRDTFVTAFFAVLEPGRLRYCNAGHLPPLLVRAGSTRSLGATTLPLGVDAQLDFSEAEVELHEGDLVFAYTDGLMEARRGIEIYGLDRLEDFVKRFGPALAPDQLVHRVHREVAGWADGLSDDAVALALRRRH